MNNIDILIASVVEYGNAAYEILESKHPYFAIKEWEDKVRLSRAFLTNTALPSDIEILNRWVLTDTATGDVAITMEEYCTARIAEDLKYIALRQSLSQAVAAATKTIIETAASAPTALPTVFQGIADTNRQALPILAGGDEEVLRFLNDALDGLLESLNEVLEEEESE